LLAWLYPNPLWNSQHAPDTLNGLGRAPREAGGRRRGEKSRCEGRKRRNIGRKGREEEEGRNGQVRRGRDRKEGKDKPAVFTLPPI